MADSERNHTGSIKDIATINNSMDSILGRLFNQPHLIPTGIKPSATEINTTAGESGYNKIVRIYKVGTDHWLSESLGNFDITDLRLGHGSYGDIYLAVNEHGKQYAVKCCDIDGATGIPNILEASIMTSMNHPYLNRALRIIASDKKLYIAQDLAVSDLAQHTRRDKGNHKPSVDQLRQWCFSLSHAVSALHVEGIIHADIKASNVLLYADGSIRLTDYGLATKKWEPDEAFTYNVCTCTHRPFECLMRRPWNEALDIWSLGCTFYEIAYGELLFPYQGVLEENPKVKDKESKARLRNRSINAIIDWSVRGPNPPTSYEVIRIKQIAIDYIPFVLCDDYRRHEMAVFNDLICHMLVVDPSQRYTISQVLAHPFFSGMKGPLYLSVARSSNKINLNEQARVTQYIYRYTDNYKIQNLAFSIYCRCNELDHLSEQIRAAACTWIASKIVIGSTPSSLELLRHKILPAERDICHNLMFRLHTV